MCATGVRLQRVIQRARGRRRRRRLGRSVRNLPDFFRTVAPVLSGVKRTQGDGFSGVLYINGGDFEDELDDLGIEPTASW